MSLFFLLPLAAGCRTFQPAAHQGHDLLDNPGRSALIRVPAGLGAIVGHVCAIPFGFVLFPTLFIDSACVESCDVLVTERDSRPVTRRGDMQIPLVQASFEYGSGLGAAVIGQPFEWIAGAFRKPPGPPPGHVEEAPELPPGAKDPDLDFSVKPPRAGG